MEKEDNQCFKINESDELTMQKRLNSALIKELRRYHQKICICESCGNSFSDEKDLKLHMKLKHGKISHKCEFWDNTFSDEEDLNMHMDVKHRKISKFKRRAALEAKPANIKQKKQKTMEEHSNISDDEIKDVAENSLFVNNRHHISAVHEGKTKPKCETCDKLFSRKSNLNKHIKGVHEKTKDFHCTICYKSYFTLYELTRHYEIVHEKIKNHQCKICHNSYHASSDLKRHISVVHKGEKNSKCDICQKLFSSKSNVNRHIEEIHEGKKQNVDQKIKIIY